MRTIVLLLCFMLISSGLYAKENCPEKYNVCRALLVDCNKNLKANTEALEKINGTWVKTKWFAGGFLVGGFVVSISIGGIVLGILSKKK